MGIGLSMAPSAAARAAPRAGRANATRRVSLGLGAAVAALASGVRAASAVAVPVMGDESIMAPKAHGTTETPVQENLRWDVDVRLADRICSFNRHYAEHAGYWTSTSFLSQVDKAGETTYYDSVTGLPLFIAPRGRTWKEFEAESRSHGWPSFRDEEVVWENMRVLADGEAVSTAGTHLGHNLPDRKGNRYCINLVSVAGKPQEA